MRLVPLLLCVAAMGIYLFSGQELTAENLQAFAPENPLLAALFLILLYACKSLTVFFPIMVLNILGGFLFEPGVAIAVNALGVLVELAIPYWMGRFSGEGFAEKLCRKQPKLEKVMAQHTGSDFFRAFFLRVISLLPGDAVSMYFGAIKMPFGICLLGSFLGTIPGTITTTLVGTSITDPTTPMFWISIGLTVILSAGSMLIYYFWKKSKKKENSNA